MPNKILTDISTSRFGVTFRPISMLTLTQQNKLDQFHGHPVKMVGKKTVIPRYHFTNDM